MIASSITFLLQLSILLLYTTYRLPDLQEAFFWPTVSVFTGWSQYGRLALPSTFMLCSEWWAIEGLTIMAGYLGVKEQAVIVVLFNFSETIFQIMSGY